MRPRVGPGRSWRRSSPHCWRWAPCSAHLPARCSPACTAGNWSARRAPRTGPPTRSTGTSAAIAEVGDTVVIGGNFSQIATAAAPATAIDRPYLFSFQKYSGALNTGFSPVVNGEITSILPTGDGQTVWIAGGFNSLNGQTVRNIAKVDLATGQRVTQFAPPR